MTEDIAELHNDPPTMVTLARQDEDTEFASEPARCSNCGTPLVKSCIGGGAATEGEGFCSRACYDEHDALGCPLTERSMYRPTPGPWQIGLDPGRGTYSLWMRSPERGEPYTVTNIADGLTYANAEHIRAAVAALREAHRV